jgi:hypothetical protein
MGQIDEIQASIFLDGDWKWWLSVAAGKKAIIRSSDQRQPIAGWPADINQLGNMGRPLAAQYRPPDQTPPLRQWIGAGLHRHGFLKR